MSTKIYNGYILKEMRNVWELKAFANKVRGKIRPIADELTHRLLAQLVAQRIDRITLGMPLDEPTDAVPYGYALATMREHARKIRETNLRDPEFDFSCSVSVIPIRGMVLALLHADRNEYRAVFESIPGVAPYPYWNNTDRPNDISDEEWDKRKEDWNIALPGAGVPNENGVLIECPFQFIPKIEEAIQYLPSLTDRARHAAREIVSNKWFEANPDKKHDMIANRTYEPMRECLDWMAEHPDGIKALANKKLEIKPKLLAPIKKEHFMEKVFSS